MAEWTVQYPVNFTPSGDTTSQSIEKHINEFTRVYDLLNRVRKFDAGTTAPTDPVVGHAWLDTSKSPWTLKVWDNSKWVGIQSLPYSAFKNHIINGGFDFWQRGTSFSSPGYTADRWCFDTDTDDSFTISRVATDGSEPFFARYFARIGLTAGTTGTYNKFLTKLEYPRSFIGKTVTISYYIKSDVPVSITNAIFFVFSGINYGPAATDVIAVGTSWTNVKQTLDLGVPNGFTESVSDFLEVAFNLPVNTTGTIDIANFQLEYGNVATEFEHRPLPIELVMCQRYFEKSYEIDVLPGTATFSGCESINLSTAGTGVIAFNTRFIVPKRSTPTITIYSPSTGASGVVYSAGADRAATVDYITNTGFRAYWNDNTTTKDNTVFHYVADSEL